MRSTVAGFGLALAIVTASSAQQEPGEQFTSPLGFPLIDTTVADVQRVFGRATVTEMGHHEQVICYVWPDSGVVVTFMSQMEGLYGSFSIRYQQETPTDECQPLIRPGSRVMELTFGGLRLGISKVEFEHTLGRIETVGADSLRASYKRTEIIDHPLWGRTPLQTRIYVYGKFMENRLVELTIMKASST